MADLARIKSNVAKMASMNAPEADIDGYIASEGVSLDEVRAFKPSSVGIDVRGALEPYKDPAKLVSGTAPIETMQRIYGQARDMALESEPLKKMREGFSDRPFLKNGPALTRGMIPQVDMVQSIGRGASPRETVKQAQGVGMDLLVGGVADALAAKGPALVGKYAAKPISNMIEEAGGRFLNFYIKPKQAAYSFGRNPGKAVARNIGPKMSRESLAEAISKKTDELTKQMEMAVSGSKKEVDITPVREHFKSIIASMGDFPETYSGPIDAHRAFANDLDAILKASGAVERNGKLFVSPATALKIKRGIGKLPSWSVSDPKLGSLTKTARQTYGQFDRAIDAAVPETRQLNEDISGLIGAGQGIEKGMMREQNKSPIGLFEIAGAGLVGQGNILSPEAIAAASAIKAMRSAPFNTTAGAVAGGTAKVGRAAGEVLEATERPALAEMAFKALRDSRKPRTLSTIPAAETGKPPIGPDMLPYNRRSEVGSFLPDATSTGKPPIMAEGPSPTIELPMVLDSDKARMVKDFGMEDFGGPKQSFQEPTGRLRTKTPIREALKGSKFKDAILNALKRRGIK